MTITAISFNETLPKELGIYQPSMEVAQGAVWIRNVLRRAGKERYVLGLSGGVDSATVAMWAARAVGPENLVLVGLPYGYDRVGLLGPSNRESVAHAQLVADRVGAKLLLLDITSTVDEELRASGLAGELDDARARVTAGDETGRALLERLELAAANTKARVRALRLRTMANREDGLLLGTENMTENQLGYFTLGGDEESDVEVLSGFFKSQVRQLALELGVPTDIVEKAPSADLWVGQTDEGELGFTYAAADLVLYYAPDRVDVVAEVVRIAEDEKARQPHLEPLPEDFPITAAAVLARRTATEFKRTPKPSFRPVHRTRR